LTDAHSCGLYFDYITCSVVKTLECGRGPISNDRLTVIRTGATNRPSGSIHALRYIPNNGQCIVHATDNFEILCFYKTACCKLNLCLTNDRKLLIPGIIIGVALCAASNFQQFAFNYSDSGKIAFITALYMFFVPLIGLFLKKRISLITWICILLGFLGLFFLSIDPSDLGNINPGDVLSLICSVFFAVHILLIERFAPDVDGIKLSCMQFFVSGTISCILMFIFETPDIEAIGKAIVPLLYSGVMSCGLAYTFQIVGQKYTEATVASLLMCMESVFGVLSGALILHETLIPREIAGCVIMFCAIILSQLSDVITPKLKGLIKRNK